MTTTALTPMEHLICRMKCHGYQRKEVAKILNRSENTMITHDKHIHEKLHANNNVEVVINYVEKETGIDIRKLIQISILLAVLLPSILMDEFSMVRIFRTIQSRTAKAGRSRRNECETDYLLEL